jgi:hypothetical protein
MYMSCSATRDETVHCQPIRWHHQGVAPVLSEALWISADNAQDLTRRILGIMAGGDGGDAPAAPMVPVGMPSNFDQFFIPEAASDSDSRSPGGASTPRSPGVRVEELSDMLLDGLNNRASHVEVIGLPLAGVSPPPATDLLSVPRQSTSSPISSDAARNSTRSIYTPALAPPDISHIAFSGDGRTLSRSASIPSLTSRRPAKPRLELVVKVRVH